MTTVWSWVRGAVSVLKAGAHQCELTEAILDCVGGAGPQSSSISAKFPALE